MKNNWPEIHQKTIIQSSNNKKFLIKNCNFDQCVCKINHLKINRSIRHWNHGLQFFVAEPPSDVTVTPPFAHGRTARSRRSTIWPVANSERHGVQVTPPHARARVATWTSLAAPPQSGPLRVTVTSSPALWLQDVNSSNCNWTAIIRSSKYSFFEANWIFRFLSAPSPIPSILQWFKWFKTFFILVIQNLLDRVAFMLHCSFMHALQPWLLAELWIRWFRSTHTKFLMFRLLAKELLHFRWKNQSRSCIKSALC
jgi:hypothetical protein